MFEVGKWYTLTTVEDGRSVISSGWKADKVKWPVVEFVNRQGKSRMINVSSSTFVEASLSGNQSDEMPVLVLSNWGDGVAKSPLGGDGE